MAWRGPRVDAQNAAHQHDVCRRPFTQPANLSLEVSEEYQTSTCPTACLDVDLNKYLLSCCSRTPYPGTVSSPQHHPQLAPPPSPPTNS